MFKFFENLEVTGDFNFDEVYMRLEGKIFVKQDTLELSASILLSIREVPPCMCLL